MVSRALTISSSPSKRRLRDGWDSGTVRPGEAVTVTLEPRSASIVTWCSVPGHRSAGMELEVVVVGPGADG